MADCFSFFTAVNAYRIIVTYCFLFVSYCTKHSYDLPEFFVLSEKFQERCEKHLIFF